MYCTAKQKIVIFLYAGVMVLLPNGMRTFECCCTYQSTSLAESTAGRLPGFACHSPKGCGIPDNILFKKIPHSEASTSIGFLSWESTRRSPLLLLRLSGVLLLRFDERQFLALLFQLPPRSTRFEPLSDITGWQQDRICGNPNLPHVG